MLFYLPAGALVDRWDRKRTMIVADAVRTLALASLALALAVGDFTFAQVVVVAFVEGCMFVFFSLSESAALPQVVPKEQIPNAVAQNQARIQGADLVGQPLGGALFGISRVLPFAADAISYGVSLISLLFVRTAFQEDRPRSVTKLRVEILEGVRWLWHQPFMRVGVLLVAGSNFAFSAMILALIVRAKSLGASSATVGVMLAFLGWRDRRLDGRTVGTAPHAREGDHHRLVPGLGARRLHQRFPREPVRARRRLGGRRHLRADLQRRLFGLPLRARTRPAAARVGSAALVVAWGAIPLGQLTAGLLLEQIGGVNTILVVAALAATVGLAASLSRTIRTAPRAEELLSSA
jgi:MFS family permease